MWMDDTSLGNEKHEIDIDSVESDKVMENYIEQCRLEFHEEWFQYLESVYA